MHNYKPESYGESLADIYDEVHSGITEPDAFVAFLERHAPAGDPLRICELAVGTGRLALPLARRGHDVTGVDVSPAMIAKLHARDPGRSVTTIVGDMVDDLPPGPFDVVFVAYTSLFMLTDPLRQAACFAAVADVLAADGVFVIEAFVPYDPPRPGSEVSVRSMAVDRLVLSASTTDVEAQRVEGHLVELVDGAAVRLHPFALRYSTPAELDGYAAAAGLTLAARFADAAAAPFDAEHSPYHLSVYTAAGIAHQRLPADVS